MEFNITVGESRLSTKWSTRKMTWEKLTLRLANAKRTYETMANYKSMNRTQKGKVKDCGGFVGGELIKDGPRRASTISSRTLVTLDIDYGRPDTIGLIEDMLAGTAWCLYSTHSCTPEAPRYRLIIPLSKSVTPDKYVPIARKVAEGIDINIFDDSTYEPSRLMYWPSCPTDADYIFKTADGDALDPDEVLSSYVDWKNVSEWPVSSRVSRLTMPNGKKQEDPTTKPGLIGAFCRCYTISEAISAFLSDIYEPTGQSGRYTYKGGSTEAGLVVYDDKFAFSHHGTDPICSKEVNAFDLVRIHKFGEEDADADPDTPVNKLPSFAAMTQFISSEPSVRGVIAEEKIRSLQEDFGNYEEDEEGENNWRAQIEMDPKTGKILVVQDNLELICANDPGLRGTVMYDVFRGRNVLMKDLPWSEITQEHQYWSESDNLHLVSYIRKVYKLVGKQVILDAHDAVMSECITHPVRNYLSGLTWDGTPRLDTLLIDYLGAVDNELTRAMTRKHFTAAVARVYNPGVKYDNVLTLTGREGIGKSTLLAKMGGEWFDDSFSSNDVGSKDAMEQVRGRWIIELGEMKEYKKSTVEAFKAFISKQCDQYRPAYGHTVEIIPRQCVFFATTNETNFLKGDTGNRRFWAVEVGVTGARKNVFALGKEDIGQIWAEAVVRYKEGESLFLSGELEAMSRERQDDYNEISADDRIGLIEAFIKTRIPSCWYTKTRRFRQDYFKCNQMLDPEDPGILRDYICAMEIANECFFKDMNRYEAKEINQMLTRLGLQYVGPTTTKDKAYGVQKRYRIDPDFYATSGQKSEVAK